MSMIDYFLSCTEVCLLCFDDKFLCNYSSKFGGEMKKEIFSVLLSITMLTCSLTGCGVKDDSSADSTVEQSQSIEYETIAPPEGGWTIEELFSVTTFFGQQVSYPLTLEQLGNDFSIDTNEVLIKKDKVGVQLYYKNKWACSIAYLGFKSAEDIKKDSPIGFISMGKEEELGNYVTINSITFGSSIDELKNALGSPTDGADKPENSDDILWEYKLNNEGDVYLYVGIHDGKVGSFLLGYF